MRICQISDTHYGITKEKSIRRMLQKMKREEFDLLVHCGDYSGGTMGHRTLRATVKMIREVFPDKPYVSCTGNHDLWCNPTNLQRFGENYKQITTCFEEHNVCFLDTLDGPYVHPDFPHIKLVGHTGWYANPNPPTNDEKWLPLRMSGDTHRFLYKKALEETQRNIDGMSKTYDANKDVVVYVSHFPVIPGPDYKGGFEKFGGDAWIGTYMQEAYGCRYFLNGHSHSLHQGPLRWEAGSDYCSPKYQLIDIK